MRPATATHFYELFCWFVYVCVCVCVCPMVHMFDFRCVQRLGHFSMNCFIGWSIGLSVLLSIGPLVYLSVTHEHFRCVVVSL